MEELILTIDVGTTGAKVCLFDPEGRVASSSYVEYGVKVPRGGWVEQSPEQWWEAAKIGIREVLKGVNPRQIKAVGITGQGPSLIPVAGGKPLMDSPLWMDVRSIASFEKLSRKLGVGVSPFATSLLQALWVMEERPETYRRTEFFLEKASDYISYKLTEKLCWTILIPYDGFVEAFRKAGLDVEKIPEMRRSDECVGQVSEGASKETGLEAGIPVVNGGADGVCAMYGAGVREPGQASVVLGASTCVDVCLERRLVDGLGRVWTTYNLVLGRWIMAGCTNTSGTAYKWLQDVLYSREVSELGREETYRLMDEEAERVEAGCGGLVFLPYLHGERSPVWDAYARGVFLGVSINHTRGHFTRALIEGCAMALYDIINVMEEVGATVGNIRLCGGRAKSRLWRQIFTDALGRPTLIPEVLDTASLGTAVLTAYATGLYRSMGEAMDSMVRFSGRVNPDASRHKVYERLYRVYKELYPRLKDLFRKRTS